LRRFATVIDFESILAKLNHQENQILKLSFQQPLTAMAKHQAQVDLFPALVIKFLFSWFFHHLNFLKKNYCYLRKIASFCFSYLTFYDASFLSLSQIYLLSLLVLLYSVLMIMMIMIVVIAVDM
jgi:hypothetical protein